MNQMWLSTRLNVILLLNFAWTVPGLKMGMYDHSTDLLLIINVTIHWAIYQTKDIRKSLRRGL